MPCVLSIFAFTNYISIDPMHSIVLSMSDAHVSGFKEWVMFGIVYII